MIVSIFLIGLLWICLAHVGMANMLVNHRISDIGDFLIIQFILWFCCLPGIWLLITAIKLGH